MSNLSQIAVNGSDHSRGIANLTNINAQATSSNNPDALKDTFQQFVGETFFQMMLKSMRSTHGKPAYLHGGQTEEIFQSQLDQKIASDLAQNAGSSFSNDLFELFRLQTDQPPYQANSLLDTKTTHTATALNDPVGALTNG